jgi:hypothetical protein
MRKSTLSFIVLVSVFCFCAVITGTVSAQDVLNKHNNAKWVQTSPPSGLPGGILLYHGTNDLTDRCMIQGKWYVPAGAPQVVETNCSGQDIADRVERARAYASTLPGNLPTSCLDQNGQPAKNCYVQEF